MATTNFYLDKADKQGKAFIMLLFSGRSKISAFG